MPLTRRSFLRRSAGLTAASILSGLTSSPALESADAKSIRCVFATDSHLQLDGSFGCAAGVVACLAAIEALQPRPDFILFGGDLTNDLPWLDLSTAEKLFDRFLTLWKDNTSLPTHFAFGNHDLAGTQNPAASRNDPRFGKGLFRQRLGLERTFYAFDAGTWRFIVLDDVIPHSEGTYAGEFVEEQLAFLRSDLAEHPDRPTVLCGHIPAMSALPALAGVARFMGAKVQTPSSSLIAANPQALFDALTPARSRVKLVLSGHLHYTEQLEAEGTRFFTGGAICGNWWRGPQAGCPEGFTVIDLHPDGSHQAVYQSYGWKARVG